MKVAVQYAVVSMLVLLLVEGVSFIGSRLLLTQQIVIEPPRAEGYVDYLAERDPLLGWPAPGQIGTREFDVSGARISPRFPDPKVDSCVSTFGDSFTWGEEVGPDHAYGNILAGLLGCRVANYGVGGYGTDQAVLRYMERIADSAPIVILGHYSDNILRNVNQLRDLTSGTRFGFKPRFVIGDDATPQVVPLPELALDDYLDVDERTADLLPYEYFLPGRLGGPVRIHFPYTSTLAQSLFHFRVQARLRGVPSYAPFYDPTHPSDALAVTEGIIGKFVETARSREQVPVVILIPDEKDLRVLSDGKHLVYQNLLEWLRQARISGPDVAALMMEHLGERDICDLFVRCGGRSHYNEEGNGMLAMIIHDWMIERGLDQVARQSGGSPEHEAG